MRGGHAGFGIGRHGNKFAHRVTIFFFLINFGGSVLENSTGNFLSIHIRHVLFETNFLFDSCRRVKRQRRRSCLFFPCELHIYLSVGHVFLALIASEFLYYLATGSLAEVIRDKRRRGLIH